MGDIIKFPDPQERLDRVLKRCTKKVAEHFDVPEEMLHSDVPRPRYTFEGARPSQFIYDEASEVIDWDIDPTFIPEPETEEY